MAPSGTKVVASNRKARHDYTILDAVEAGIVLHGSEVKSLRDGKVQLADSFARMPTAVDARREHRGLRLRQIGAHEPDRPRKLLLHRKRSTAPRSRVNQERLSLVPLSVYFKDGKAKVELALARGSSKTHDKRQVIARRATPTARWRGPWAVSARA